MLVDSSALIPLSRAGRLPLLRELHGRVKTTQEVRRECVDEGAGRPGQAALEEAFGSWIEVVPTPPRARRLAQSEGLEVADAGLLSACEARGEELLTNDYLLMRAAEARGVRGRWLTGVVIEAARKGVLGRREARDLMARLMREGLRLSPEVYSAVLAALEDIGRSDASKG